MPAACRPARRPAESPPPGDARPSGRLDPLTAAARQPIVAVMMLRTRFAPSPTGFLHIGGVRTALFNWLLARHHGGQFILRIDDTDQQRHVEDAVKRILDGFRWIGIDWDEGPEVGGPHGPYYQSERAEIYRRAAERLVASGYVYKDYSTEQERAADKAAAEREKRAYRFRRLPISDADAARFKADGRPYALRFQVPTGRTLVLQDLIKGDVEFNTDEIGDFVIVRPDGTPLYNFASAVDDIEMKITHVVRAEEHLSNTFPQLLVFEALGADLPAFAHIPYVAEPGSRAKMSKRKLAEYEKQGVLVYLHQYIEKGYLPEALLNYLARLGWAYDASQEVFARDELIEKFTLDRVNSAPASHDQDKLFWLEGEWMKTDSPERKLEGVLPFLRGEGLASDPLSDRDRDRIERVIAALGDRLKVFSDILKLGRFFFTDAITYDPDAVKKRLRKDGVPAMLVELDRLLAETEPYDLTTLEKAVHDYAERTGRKMGDVVNPLRVAVTGQGVGPGLYDCLVILGRESCRARIARALEMLEQPSTS
jgi:glutamyl-tRNA synthetase